MVPQEVIDSANETSMAEILAHLGYELDIQGYCPSPFRKGTDEYSKSFSVHPTKNIWTDWKLRGQGYSGGPIKFVQLFYGLSFIQSVLMLAVSNEIISEKEARKYGWKGFGDGTMAPIRAEKVKKVELKVAPLAALETLHAVYSAMMELSPLTEADRAYLLGRGLTEQEIVDGGFFSMPSRTIARKLERLGHNLLGVPGFYKATEEALNMSFLPVNGIAFPIRTIEGKIQGIQVRTNQDGDKKNRYFWLSSAKADGVTTNRNGAVLGFYGCGPGTPQDYISGGGTYFVTEGKFKEIAVQRYFPWTTVSVQGVGNWQGIDISEAEEVIIGYDADMMDNDAVLNQIIKLADFIEAEDKSAKIAVWDINYGKGIDDVLYSGNGSKVELLTYEEFVDYVKQLKRREK